ncbi:hypothetical protein BGW38_010790 [Lunasporangiospora selenospora]|uniref:Calponin-homology (CH) domain-containing protein n=1 Tax=Lunasporangiospora selenospora TaxID=979761 RepID=A0A9P6FVS6_9FUNG|nr:hypothetical protein BGW38_010790 [Lunasporangiospora selenospora]
MSTIRPYSSSLRLQQQSSQKPHSQSQSTDHRTAKIPGSLSSRSQSTPSLTRPAPNDENRPQSSSTSLLRVPAPTSGSSSIKRKLSRTEVTTTSNKVHLRRHSDNSAEDAIVDNIGQRVTSLGISNGEHIDHDSNRDNAYITGINNNWSEAASSQPLKERTASSQGRSFNISSGETPAAFMAPAATDLTETMVASTAETSRAEESQTPMLIMIPFQSPPWVEFGRVVIGTKKIMSLLIQNPTDVTEKLVLDSGSKMEEMGFNIRELDPIHTNHVSNGDYSGDVGNTVESLTVLPRSTIEVTVGWTPLTVGSIRASAVFKTRSARYMVYLRGRGELSSMIRNSVSKVGASAMPPAPGGYSTLPYLTSNDMYDEKWIDKQERAFTQWLNHEFNVTVDTFSARDPSSWSYYSHKLEFEHTRAAAFKIYQSDTFRIVLRKVEESIGKDRLQLRPDSNLVGDVGTRREIMDLLFSFEIRWLVLGLETITGQAAAISPSFDRATISGFINKAIFHDKKLEAEYEPDRILSNRPKYYQTMNRLVLKRLFMLIMFLDKAKQAKLIQTDPCLFNRESEVKSCRTLLLTISKNYLLGEGDIIRHLLFMGYSVVHTQTALDELDFTVKNLAVDLRDGVRLCRLVDMHCPELNLCLKMKFPALSKVQMQQNVALAVNALVRQGIAMEGTRGGLVSPRDVVEGHREKTFGLLWKLILNWKVSVLLDLRVLEAEIEALKQEYRRIHGVDQPERVDTVYFTSNQLSALLRWCQAIGAFYGIEINNFTKSFSDGRGFGALLSYYHPTLLDMSEMKDSGTFLEEYKMGLHQNEPPLPEMNDGKGWFIDTRDLKDPVAEAKEMDRFNYRLLHHKIQALGGVPITLRHADLSHIGIPDEKAVILFVTYLCARLMHLNKDIRAAKTIQRIWRQKHYGRREESRIQAAIILQKYIRGYLVRKHQRTLEQQKHDAVVMIQSGCRMYLAQWRTIQRMEFILALQTQCRGFLARKPIIELLWAVLIAQSHCRGQRVRRQYQKAITQHRFILDLQAQARKYLVRKRLMMLQLATDVVHSRRFALLEMQRIRTLYLRIVNAAILIQRHWRATIAGRAARQQYLDKRQWVVQLQSHTRGVLVRQSYQDLVWAAVVIQRQIRTTQLAKRIRYKFQELRWAARVIQARWRSLVVLREQQHEYQVIRWCAIAVQQHTRGMIIRRQHHKLRAAAFVVQRRRRALVDGRTQFEHFQQLRLAAYVIQDRWRAVVAGRTVRQQYLEHRSTMIRMQASIRGFLLRQRLIRVMQENEACMIIQTAWRGYIQRRAYLQWVAAAIRIQQAWRAVLQQREVRFQFEETRWAATVIQRWWRAQQDGQRVRDEYDRLRKVVIAMQSIYRGQVARRDTLALWTIVKVQAIVRARFAQWNYERLRTAARVIQRHWRAYQSAKYQRREYGRMVTASIVIQRTWRAVQERRRVQYEYQTMRHAVIATQAQVRGAMVRHQVSQLCWAAVVIQQKWRAKVEAQFQRQAYLELWNSARIIQAAWRSTQLTRWYRTSFLELQWAATVIQRRRRHVLEDQAMQERIFEEQTTIALMIQTAARGYLVRAQVRDYLEDQARIAQRWAEATVYSLAAIRIQRSWRRYQDTKWAEVRENAAIRIQRWWRYRLEIKEADHMQWLARAMQTQIRGVLARQQAMRRMEAIVIVQSWWRGCQVRQECSAKVKAARKRIEHANATAEEHMKLGNRTTMALDILLSSGQLSAVLKACYHLDVVTRLSKNSCLRLVEHNVVNIIFQLIKSCNRSQPHMEVLKHGLNIVENLSRDPDTVGSVFWAPEGMEILVDCAQAYRENELVFESVVTILLIHLEQDQDENRRRVMRSMTPEVKKLRGVLTVMERKLEREERSGGGSRGHHPTGSISGMGSSRTMTGGGGGRPVRLLVSSVNKLRRIVELLA